MEKSLRKVGFVVTVIAFGLSMRFLIEFAYNATLAFFDVTSVLGFLFRSLGLMAFFVVWLIITLRSENYQTKLPWLMLLLLDPISGMVLFLTFGRSFKRSSRYKKRPLMVDSMFAPRMPEANPQRLNESTLDPNIQTLFYHAHKQTHLPPYLNQTHTTLYQNGETFYPALLKDLEAAKDFILMSFFIIRDDVRGTRFMDMLKQKAQEGLTVKLIVDGLGSARLKRKTRHLLKAAGVDFIIQDPIYFPMFNTRINYRNHRKIVVIDGTHGYTGGMNLANEYDNTIPHDYYFRDTMIKLEGEAVKSLTAIFFKDYYYNTGVFIDEDRFYPPTKTQANGVVQVIESGPDSEFAHIRDVYTRLILSAKHTINIMTPYMALDQETLTALKVAARSGVRVNIIIPGTPDKWLVYRVTKFFMGTLLKHGVNLYTYTPGFSHAKVLIVDDTIGSVGSYNLDNRSAVIDFELTTLFVNESVKLLVDAFEKDLKASHKHTYEQFKSRRFSARLLEGALSIFTPIL